MILKVKFQIKETFTWFSAWHSIKCHLSKQNLDTIFWVTVLVPVYIYIGKYYINRFHVSEFWPLNILFWQLMRIQGTCGVFLFLQVP